MPEDPYLKRREGLLDHLNSLYFLARSLTASPEDATRLVEATYSNAFIALPVDEDPRDDKRWILAMMVQTHRQRTEPAFLITDPPPPSLHIEDLPKMSQGTDILDMQVKAIAERLLPLVLATLPRKYWLALFLIEAQGLSTVDAGVVLNLVPSVTSLLYEEAHAILASKVQEAASAFERPLLKAHLTHATVHDILRETMLVGAGGLPKALPVAIETMMVKPLIATPVLASSKEGASARERTAASRQPAPRNPLRQALFAVIIVTLVALTGYLASSLFNADTTEEENASQSNNLITLAAQQADQIVIEYVTNSAELAEGIAERKLGFRLTVPTIDQAIMKGVGIHNVVPGLEIPVFIYEDQESEARHRIALFVCSYVMLDRFKDQIMIESDILRQIQEEQRYDLFDLGENSKVLIWRHRDDIFIAVTPGNATVLRKRIVFPS